jgi:hypothetical protein
MYNNAKVAIYIAHDVGLKRLSLKVLALSISTNTMFILWRRGVGQRRGYLETKNLSSS